MDSSQSMTCRSGEVKSTAAMLVILPESIGQVEPLDQMIGNRTEASGGYESDDASIHQGLVVAYPLSQESTAPNAGESFDA